MMKKLKAIAKRFLVWSFVLTAFIGTIAWFSVPGVIRHFAAKQGVIINGDIDWAKGVFNDDYIALNGIDINKSIVKGVVHTVKVKVSFDDIFKPKPTDIKIDGGSLKINIPKPKEKAAKPKKDINPILDSISLIRLNDVEITHPKGHVKAVGIHCITLKECLVAGFGAEVKGVPIKNLQGSNVIYSKGSDVVRFENVKGSLTNLNIPGIDKAFEFDLSHGQLNIPKKEVKVKSAKLGTLGNAKRVTLSRNERVQISIGELTSNVPGFHGKSTNLRGWYCPDEDCEEPKGEFDLKLPGIAINGNYKEMRASSVGACDAWAISAFAGDPLESLTSPMFEDGNISFDLDLKRFKAKLKEECKTKCDASIFNFIRAGKFEHRTYKPDGTLGDWRETGPRTPNWATAKLMSPEALQAFIQLEDPSFRDHDGIVMPSLLLAAKQNMRLGKMHVGGSTITQQLVKNLWLTREKSVLRKVREALLSFAIEDCFTKDEILELYLNVVEFGPNVYGINRGAKHHFEKSFVDLTQEEAFYLASILPRPNNARPPGNLSRTKSLIASLKDNGFLKAEQE